MKSLFYMASLGVLICNSVNAQTCYDGVTETTPSERFVDNLDGTVSDTDTGLMWQRCNYGQTYNVNNSTCDGNSVQLSWQEALRGATNSELVNFKDWQVPNVKELASIVEHQCVEPSINQTVFFDTQPNNYWSSTSGVTRPDLVWVYQFDDGLNNLQAKGSDVYLRLVRYEK